MNMHHPTIYLLSALLFALPVLAAPASQAKMFVCPDCGCAADNRTFDKAGKCPECGMDLVEKGGQQE